MEFVNRRIRNRKKLVLYLVGSFGVLLLSIALKYYFAPKEVQEGVRYSKYYYSFNQFIFLATGIVLFFIVFVTSSRIILKMTISNEAKTLTVEFIDRFKTKPTVYTVKLSQVQIAHGEVPENKKYGLKASKTLTLTNPKFGKLNVTELDFFEIDTVASYFDKMKNDTAARIRQKRLASKRNK